MGVGRARNGVGPVVDPTQNVLDLVRAAIDRQDDLRDITDRGLRDMIAMNAAHASELRDAEAKRIDAIRAVDVGAVNRAAEVSAQQAMTLAAKVAQSAETLRTQVAAAATAATVALAAALEPIQKDIADLRRAQYEAQGKQGQTADTRLNVGTVLGCVAVVVSLAMFVLILMRG
jgi:hypothetical protein